MWLEQEISLSEELKQMFLLVGGKYVLCVCKHEADLRQRAVWNYEDYIDGNSG